MSVNIQGGALEFDAIINNSDFKAQINAMEQRLISLTKTTNQQAEAVDNYAKKAAIAVGSYLSFASATNFLQEIVTVRGEFQKLEVSFETMLKSKAKADELMAQAVQLAAITPFTLEDVGSGAKQLLAYGFAQDKVINTLQMLGDVAAGVGAPLNDIVYTYGTLQTQGRAYTRDIMQFTTRGIPIIEELAKQFGVSKTEVQALVEAGKVGFPQVEQAFKNLTGQGGLFFNLMEKQSKTLTGQISNLEDAWSRMLNDIGTENEGFLASTLEMGIEAVNNYQKIIDILKVIAVSYGAYRAALVATAVAQQVSNIVMYETALAGRAVTVSQALQSFATKSLQQAWKFLTATLMANPFVAIATVLATVTTALIVFSKETAKAKTSAQLLSKAQADITSGLNEQEATIKTYISIIQNQNATEKERLTAYNRLKEISPDIVSGLTLQQAATADLTLRTNEYISSLRRQLDLQRLQAAFASALKQKEEADKKVLEMKKQGKDKVGITVSDRLQEFNEGGILGLFYDATTEYAKGLVNQKQADKALDDLEKEIRKNAGSSNRTYLENDLKRLTAEQNLYTEGVKKGVKSDIEAYNAKQAKINELKAQLDQLNKAETAPKNMVRNEAFLKSEIQRITDLRAPFALASKEYKFYSEQIARLQNELNPKRATVEENKELKAQQSILEDIIAAKRESAQSGMTKELTEIDKVNQSYEDLFEKINKHNKEVKNSKFKISQDAILGLKNAQNTQIENVSKRQAEEKARKEAEDRARAYETELNRFAKIYENYEVSKRQIGLENAKQLYKDQIGENDTYMAYLQKEFTKYLNDSSKEGVLKVGVIAEAITNAYTAGSEKEFDKRKEDFIRLFELTADFNQKQKQLETQLQKDISSIKKDFSGDEQIKRLAIVRGIFQEETKALQLEAIKQGNVYKSLGRDLLAYSKDELKERIKELRKTLKDGFVIDGFGKKVALTPQMKQDLKSSINQTEQLTAASRELFGTSVEKIAKVAEYAGLARDAFATLAESVAPMNRKLSETLTTMSDIANQIQGMASLGIGIATGDPSQIVSGALSVLTGYIKVFSRAMDSINKSMAEMERFQAAMLAGEIDTNIQYRERLRIQELINKTKIQGLNDESKLLAKQKEDNLKEYNKILALIQKESFISGQHTVRSRGSLLFGLVGYLTGIGATTSVVNDLSSLAGKNFEQLQELFNKGQLTDKAKELFTQLQKLKQEGVDIDKELENIKNQINEIFTSTTSDSISDSLIEGFKQGKKSAADFADSFQELMQGAILNALKYQTLEKPLQEFYNQFAQLSQSGDILTSSEIEQLRKQYNDIINNASQQFDNLQQIAGVGFGAANGGNSLSGAIKGMTESQADLLAGQFGGLRITALEQLNISKSGLDRLREISNNTGEILALNKKWDLIGLKVK